MTPRLRKDLVATAADEQGVACVEVVGPGQRQRLSLLRFRIRAGSAADGQPLEQVVDWARATYGIDLSPEALDQFLEKLRGLGFLEGSTAGAQPSILAPFSPSSGAQPFGDLPTTVAVDAVAARIPSPRSFQDPRDPDRSGAVRPGRGQDARPGASGVPARAAAERPRPSVRPLLSGCWMAMRRSTSLKGAGSGLWERPQGLLAVSPPPATEPSALLPQLQVLADPLPPVAAEPAVGSAKPVDSSGGAPFATASFPMASDMPRPVTPPPNISIPVRWPPLTCQRSGWPSSTAAGAARAEPGRGDFCSAGRSRSERG